MKQILFIVALISTVFSAPEPFEHIVAVVDGKIILYSDMMQAVYQLESAPGFSGLPADQLQKKVLDRLIDDKVILAKARKDTIAMSDAEVEQRVEAHLQNLALRQKLDMETLSKAIQAQMGLTMNQYREKLSNQILEQGLLQKVRSRYVGLVEPTRKDVEGFYAEYKDSLPLQYNCLKVSHMQIKVKPSKSLVDSVLNVALSLIDSLDQGEKFESLAKRWSQDPTGANGGDIGFFRRGSLEPEYERAAFRLGLGKYTERPVRSSLGYHIIQKLAEKDNEVRSAHILLQIVPTATDSAQTKKMTDSLRTLAISKKNFSELAVKHSDDKETRLQGGNLGWFEKGELDSLYQQVISNLGPGEMSEPIFIEDSWHLFFLEEEKDQRKLNLKEDYSRILEMAKNIFSNRKLQVFVDQWRKEVYIDIRPKPGSLEVGSDS